jgi:UDP-N-acetylglucosamine 2-epimerase
MDEWKNILSADNEKLTDEDLLRYLKGNLSEEEKNKIEIKVTGSFESDAVDGLKQIEDKARIERHVNQLNQKLPHLLRHKKHRSDKRKLKDLQWIIVAIIILLFLCIMTYVMIIKTHS